MANFTAENLSWYIRLIFLNLPLMAMSVFNFFVCGRNPMSSQNANNQKQIELSPEVVRMAQMRASRQGLQFRQELARLVAEEAVIDLDCELGLLLENELSMNQSDV